MPLDKNIISGTKIRIKSLKSKTAGIVVDGVVMNGITLWDSNSLGQIKVASAQIGDILTVVKKPRKVNGINVCQVDTVNGIRGEVYWTELRSNCEV